MPVHYFRRDRFVVSLFRAVTRVFRSTRFPFLFLRSSFFCLFRFVNYFFFSSSCCALPCLPASFCEYAFHFAYLGYPYLVDNDHAGTFEDHQMRDNQPINQPTNQPINRIHQFRLHLFSRAWVTSFFHSVKTPCTHYTRHATPRHSTRRYDHEDNVRAAAH